LHNERFWQFAWTVMAVARREQLENKISELLLMRRATASVESGATSGISARAIITHFEWGIQI